MEAIGLLNLGKQKNRKIRGCVVGQFGLLNFGKSKFSEIRIGAVGAVVWLNVGAPKFSEIKCKAVRRGRCLTKTLGNQSLAKQVAR